MAARAFFLIPIKYPLDPDDILIEFQQNDTD